MDPSTIDMLASADPATLIAFAKTAGFATLVSFIAMGLVELIKEICKAHGWTYPSKLLPLPLVSAIAGMLVMDVGLLLLGGSPLLLGRYAVIGAAAGLGGTGLYGLKSAGSEPPGTVQATLESIPGTLETVQPPLQLQVVHSIGEPLPPPQAPQA